MKITLERLVLHNFKGQREFTLSTAGRSVNIFGDNGVGKTTIADSFMWLLFDKNAQDRADFEIKTLQEDGGPLHGLDHSVEGVFSVDNESLTLKKVYREKWTKQRGSASKQFTGHEVDHFINGVPVKKGEYTEKVQSIIREDLFKLLTNVRHFNEGLHWEKRRELLLEICGDVSDADIIHSNPALSELTEILGNRTLDDYSKIALARRSEINKELERIPIRIDELRRSRKDTGIIFTEAIAKRKLLKDTISELTQKQAEIHSGGAVGEKTAKLRELEAELLNQQNVMHREGEKELSELRQALTLAEEELSAKLREKTTIEAELSITKADTVTIFSKLEEAQQNYNNLLNEKTEDPKVDTVCPACNQDLPPDRIEEARQKAKAIRNAERARSLEAMTVVINERAAKVKMNQDKMRELDNRLGKIAIKPIEDQIKYIKERYENVTPTATDATGLIAEIEKTKADIELARQNNSAAIDEITAKILYNSNELEKLETAIAQENLNAQSKDRENELKRQERELSSEYETLERHLYLIDEFTKTKVKMLNAKINDRFRFAEFKLFNELVNGGIEPTCVTTYQGVPYNNLNNGARINIGVDIINTLAEHYGLTAPIFIDQREAVTRLIDTDAQIVSLIVSEPDKELRVELQ